MDNILFFHDIEVYRLTFVSKYYSKYIIYLELNNNFSFFKSTRSYFNIGMYTVYCCNTYASYRFIGGKRSLYNLTLTCCVIIAKKVYKI